MSLFRFLLDLGCKQCEYVLNQAICSITGTLLLYSYPRPSCQIPRSQFLMRSRAITPLENLYVYITQTKVLHYKVWTSNKYNEQYTATAHMHNHLNHPIQRQATTIKEVQKSYMLDAKATYKNAFKIHNLTSASPNLSAPIPKL